MTFRDLSPFREVFSDGIAEIITEQNRLLEQAADACPTANVFAVKHVTEETESGHGMRVRITVQPFVSHPGPDVAAAMGLVGPGTAWFMRRESPPSEDKTERSPRSR